MKSQIFVASSILVFGLVTTAQESSTFYKNLALKNAPLIIHSTGKNPHGDIPTNFDFDGDIIANNNWDNLDRFELQPAVYYEVIETETHYFVTYGFFHPRDYTNFCTYLICHENDFEGAILVLKKTPSEKFGEFVMMQTLAHVSVSKDTKPIFYDTVHGLHRPTLAIGSGGHAVSTWKGKFPKNYFIFAPNDQEPYENLPQEVARYKLIPMKELWKLRDQIGKGKTFIHLYDFKNERFELKHLPAKFAGEKYGTASLPWTWKNSLWGKRGEWFLDPAWFTYHALRNPNGFSLKYIHHLYLEIGK